MNIEESVYNALEKVIGLSKNDFSEYEGEKLTEIGIFDSMSTVSFLNELSSLLGKKITIDKFKVSDFFS